MGSSSSFFKPFTPPQEEKRKTEILPSDEEDEEDEEDEDPRPAKRRKTTTTNSTSSLNHDSSEQSISSCSSLALSTATPSLDHSTSEESQKPTRISSRSQVKKIKPSDFYDATSSRLGESKTISPVPKSKPDLVRIDSVLKLTETPVDFQKLLRINVVGIIGNSSHGDDEGEESNQYSNIKCTLALLRVSEDDSLVDIYRQPQTGRIRRIAVGHQNDTFPVYLPPFIVPSAVLCQDPNFDDSSDQPQRPNELGTYGVELLIEPYNAKRKDWLPLSVSSLPHNSHIVRKISNGEARFDDVRQIICKFMLFDHNSKQNTAQIELIYDGERVKTSASLKLDIQWSLPSHLNKEYESAEVSQFPTPVPELVSEIVLPRLQSPQKEGVIEPGSPSRAQRRGRTNVTTYNLKALSAKAQGKQLKARWNRENPGASARATDTGESVTYTFSKVNVEAYDIKQVHVVAGFSCPICGSDCKSMEILRLHFTTTHDRFKFHVRPKSSFYVEFNKEPIKSRRAHPLQTVQLGRVITLLDIEKYLSGDSSWAEVREGPQNNQWPNDLARSGIETLSSSSTSSSPQSSRQSSPEILNGDNELKEGESSVPVPAYIRRMASLRVRSKKKYYVPDIKNLQHPRSAYVSDVEDRVIYDLLTKRVLKPGEELVDSDDEKNETWLLHKRKWIINDYIDLTDDEKEYFIKWEEFILGERFTTNMSHLAETIMRFVARNRVWFAEKIARKKEWYKHMELLIVNDGLETQPLLSRCDQFFQQGKKELGAKSSTVSSSTPESRREVEGAPAKEMRGWNDCICGDPVQAPDQVVCAGKLCPDPHHHQKCAEKCNRAIGPKGTWLCDGCHGKANVSARAE
ncbi:hypothetical protein DSL72_002258 [Monilinia vaccinii-corymbosi]|uniref:C2H2-type domain-containing protein n=1 Tax=Monilinia vaccinii-corymbosi TaxID=61207 RepID=A0A8A3PC61_9HELO|nr:hypothetical protein DSL72_002258 [Monilinia vaccinii-corymbosi]